MDNHTSLERLSPALPVEVTNAIADALMDVALRDYNSIIRDTVLNCRLAGRVFNNAVRDSMFCCVYLSSRFATKGRKLVNLVESDPALLSSIRHFDLTFDSSLMREEADVVAVLFSMLLHGKHSRIRSLRLAGDCRFSDDAPANWTGIMGHFIDLGRTATELMFSPRLSRLEIVNFECFPLRQVLSSCRTDIHTLRIENVHSIEYPIGRGFYLPGGRREPKLRRLELDQTALEELKWIYPEHRFDARECLAHFKRVDELCIINPDLRNSTINSDAWSWRYVLNIMQNCINSLTIELKDYTALDLLLNLLSGMSLPFLHTFSLTVNVIPDGGYQSTTSFKLVTGLIKLFLSSPSVIKALSSPSLSSIVLQINHTGVRWSYDVFHKDLANHLTKPIFELGPDGNSRMRYRNVHEVILEIYSCLQHGAPRFNRPETRHVLRQFSPKKILAVQGTFASDHWDNGLRKVGEKIFLCSSSIWTRVVALPHHIGSKEEDEQNL